MARTLAPTTAFDAPDGGEPDAPATLAKTQREPVTDDFVIKVLTVGMVIGLMTQKVAFLFGPTALQVTLILQFIVFGFLAYGRRIKVDSKKLVLFLILGSLCVLVHILAGSSHFSFPSLLFVLSIYFTYTFVTPISQESYRKYILWFQYIGVGACALVFMDWAVQLVGLPMPNIEHIIPKSMLFFNYVYIQPVEWGSHWWKPNGYFFLETSYVGQFIAFALLIEVCLFQRLRYLMLFAVGLLSTFGGTGMTCVLLSLPVALFYFRLKLLPLALIALPVVGIAAVQIGVTDNIQKRSSEFGTEGKSGNTRFTAQFERVGEVFAGDTKAALFGMGAGEMPRRLHMMWTPISKVLVEYGLFVWILMAFYLPYCMFGRGVPFIISWIMLLQYLFLNGSFLVPINNFLPVMLCAMFCVEGASRGAWVRASRGLQG